ncbi:hypothetical protein TNCV_2672581 [Trichonephila clavipes]|nr:hypothetical protein TNCV_2672581 [Trichonephila clavipes]
MLEKVIENWTSRLDYIRASRGSPMPEIIFKILEAEGEEKLKAVLIRFIMVSLGHPSFPPTELGRLDDEEASSGVRLLRHSKLRDLA